MAKLEYIPLDISTYSGESSGKKYEELLTPVQSLNMKVHTCTTYTVNYANVYAYHLSSDDKVSIQCADCGELLYNGIARDLPPDLMVEIVEVLKKFIE